MYRGLLPSAIAMLPEAAITYGGKFITSCVHCSCSMHNVLLRTVCAPCKTALLACQIELAPPSAGMFDTLKARHRNAHGGAEPGIAHVLSFGVASAFCGQVWPAMLSKCSTD